ncbi:thiamine-phosphate synthase [Thalassospira profundimaris]|uniref:Thiamine-phosphate synthase n=1 Tax=Thalassospira profundimaris TaxID=502049 RepID=A0A367XKG6_9PROT|nr:thiamine phosphate synthase [Thalassospira profundimaris]RCK54125.1 thiamine-phosphate synthase [Thalassospira profundimaris]
MTFDLSLYLVLDPDLCRDHSMLETTMAAIRGGATMVQLRHKTASTREFIEIGRALRAAMAGSGVPLIVNDNIEAAIAIDAHGLHVGQDDMPAEMARQKLGKDKILGLSIESEAVARKIDKSVIDYVGIGPVFATSTKPDHKPAIGFEGLAHLTTLCNLPSVAIGGVKQEHVTDVLESGADGLAVVSAICGQKNPETATRQLADAIKNARARLASGPFQTGQN